MGCKWEKSCNYALHQKWLTEIKGCDSKLVSHFERLCKKRFDYEHLLASKTAILEISKKKHLTKTLNNDIIKPSKESEVNAMKRNMKDSIIITACPLCGHSHVVKVNEADYLAWKGGALVQDAFPYLTADERELLISGICSTCWERSGVPDGR